MLKDLLLAARSYRGFDESRVITRVELEDIVDHTRFTAASGNIQPLKYYLSCEHDEVEAILAETKWAALLPELNLPYEGKHPTAFVVICQDLEVSTNQTLFLKDVGIAGQIISMAAAEKGLGALLIGNFSPVKLAELLKLPETLVPMLVVAIGKPDETVVLTEVKEDGSTKYYRDEAGVHYVPKRSLEEIVIK